MVSPPGGQDIRWVGREAGFWALHYPLSMAGGSTVRQARAAPSPAVRAGLVSLLAGVVILAAKIAASWLTGSTALLADAAESTVNVIAAALVTYTVVVSARPPDEDHPYGHGKAQTLSAMVEGGLIGLAALFVSFEAVRRLVLGPELERLGVGIAISTAAGLANLLLGLYLLRVARSERSEALRADGVHVLTDTATTAGGVAALVAVSLTGWVMIDPLVGLAVAANILWAGWRVVRRALVGLLDEADFDLLVELARHLESVRESSWCEIHQLRAWAAGDLRHVDLHLVVPRYLSIDEAHAQGDDLQAAIVDLLEQRADVVVHVDPCRPEHCSGCSVSECPVRAHALVRRVPFDVDTLTREGAI